MDRKQGIIRLGRSKSPHSRISKGHSRVDSFTTSRASKEKDPLQQSQQLNQSMHVPVGKPRPQLVLAAQTTPSFFPPSPQSIQQRVIIKENLKSPIHRSPVRTVVVRTVTQSSPNQPRQQVPQIELQWQRKIKVLESRVQELHKEKQTNIIQAHQENKRVVIQNQQLQRKLAECEGQKNQQIAKLRQELANLQKVVSQFTSHPQPPRISFGIPQQETAPEKGKTSLKGINSHPSETDSADTNEYICRIQFLESENQRLKTDIQEMKEAVMKTTSIIEQNNQKIIEDYENRVNQLAQQADENQVSVEQSHKVKQQLQFANKQIEDYVSRLCKKSKESSERETQIENLRKQLQFSSKQSEDYVSRLCKKSKQVTKLQEQLQRLKAPKEGHEGNEEQLIEDRAEQQQVKNQIIQDLAKQLQTSESKLQEAENKIRQLQIQLSQPPESCTRCQELVKALSKLNSKTLSRTA